MKSLLLFVSAFMALTLSIGTSPARAEKNGYAFVFAYSYALKEAYHSPIFTHPVNGESMNDKEYVADIRLIRKIEDAFEQHLRNKLHVNTSLFDFTARTGFKNEAIAKSRLEDEKADLKIQGIVMKPLNDFTFKDEQ
jgi:hypothetical protein